MDPMPLWQLLLHFDQHLGAVIEQYGALVYALLFAVVVLEIGVLPLFFLPGDSLLFVCGAFCASGYLELPVLMPLLFMAALGGSVLSFGTGRALGRRALVADYRWVDREALSRAQVFYARHGAATFVLSPFIAVVRTFAPFVAGVADMPRARFVMAAAAGALLWAVSLPVAGYFFGNVPLLRDHLGALVLVCVAIGVGVVVTAGAWRHWRRWWARQSGRTG